MERGRGQARARHCLARLSSGRARDATTRRDVTCIAFPTVNPGTDIVVCIIGRLIIAQYAGLRARRLCNFTRCVCE